MPGRVTGDPQHWRDRAAQMRALALTMKDPEVIILMTDLAADYENLGTGRPRRWLSCRQVVDAMARRFLRNEGSSANALCSSLYVVSKTGTRRAPGMVPALACLFKAAKTLPALRTNATVSAITSGVFMADLANQLAPESCHPVS